MTPCVVAVARMPVAGKVKSRIAEHLGEQNALELYQCSLADTIELLSRLDDVQHALSFTPPTEEAQLHFQRLAPGFVLVQQQGEDFGDRLFSTFVALQAQGFSPIVLIGSDSPSLPHAHITESLDRLANSNTDLVLGPAMDGGSRDRVEKAD